MFVQALTIAHFGTEIIWEKIFVTFFIKYNNH